MKRAWIVVVLLWSLLRSFIVGHTLHRYGVDPWAYFVVDLSSALPYGIASSKLVDALAKRDGPRTRQFAFASLAAFVAPDVYLILAAKHMPRSAYIILGIVIVLLAVLALWGIIGGAAQRREARAATTSDRAEHPSRREPPVETADTDEPEAPGDVVRSLRNPAGALNRRNPPRGWGGLRNSDPQNDRDA